MQELIWLRECLKAANEVARLRAENEALRKKLGLEALNKVSGENSSGQKTAPVTASSPNKQKVAFFHGLFQGRADVYAVRWARRDGKAGYSPACGNEWQSGCGKE